jgi:hypothetical protein
MSTHNSKKNQRIIISAPVRSLEIVVFWTLFIKVGRISLNNIKEAFTLYVAAMLHAYSPGKAT